MKIKGRCTACWGGLVLRGKGENGVVSGIECCVCKEKLVGEDAANAYQRVLEEAKNQQEAAGVRFAGYSERHAEWETHIW